MLHRVFRTAALRTSKIMGTSWCFGIAVILIVGWMITGPLFQFSNTWQLIINTATTIITFLMVFLLQYTQNRDTKAVHLKLDELIYVNKKARNALLDAEEILDDDEMERETEGFRQKRNGSEY